MIESRLHMFNHSYCVLHDINSCNQQHTQFCVVLCVCVCEKSESVLRIFWVFFTSILSFDGSQAGSVYSYCNSGI